MDSKKAREILGDTIERDGSLRDLHNYIDWSPGELNSAMDGLFSADELEAIAWWMRNTKKEGKEDEKL